MLGLLKCYYLFVYMLRFFEFIVVCSCVWLVCVCGVTLVVAKVYA